MVAFGAMAFMLMAGWQFNIGGTEEVFSDKDLALENAYAGSGNNVCYNTITSASGHQVRYCPGCQFINNSAAPWYAPSSNC